MMVPVGFREGVSVDETRQNWNGTGARPLVWSAWYPVGTAALVAVSTEPSWFRRKPVAHDAPLRSSAKPFPLVLLSHGSGASTAALEWLAYRLAQRGYVALAVNHHGHTGAEPYRAEGFLCLWERARDLSVLLSDPSWRLVLGGTIADSANVAGFSAGAYTAMLIMGARVAYSQFEPGNPVKTPIRGPREFPNLADQLQELQANPIFRESWDRRHGDYSDARFRSAAVIAPGRSVLGFAAASLQRIRNPIRIFGGDADTVAPPTDCCEWLHNNVADSSLEVLSGGVGHYTFLPEGSETGVKADPELFHDKPGVERSAIHEHVALSIANFFSRA